MLKFLWVSLWVTVFELVINCSISVEIAGGNSNSFFQIKSSPSDESEIFRFCEQNNKSELSLLLLLF
jgi:hypothetical protein